MASLLEMSEWGGTNAASLKLAIDNIFSEKGQLPLKSYETKLVAATADGAAVNFGRIKGLMTRLCDERNWLLKIHCINHCIELAVKDAFKNSKFKKVEDFYNANFNLLKASGKIKSEVTNAATSLGIQAYTLPKLKGTRFVGHRFAAMRRLVDMWPAFDLAYENVIADKVTKEETRAKVKGLLRSFRNYEYLALVCCFLDLLEKTRPCSKVFEGKGLLPFEIWPSAQQTIDDLRELVDEQEECLDSNLRRFEMKEDDDGKVYLEGEYTRTNDNLRSVENQRPVLVYLCNITNIRNEVKRQALRECRVVAEKLVEEVEDRFEGYNEGIYNSMKWFDPMHWTAEKDFGASDLSEFASHFEKPLQATKFDLKRALKEWSAFKKYVAYNMKGTEARQLWASILAYREKEYPNLCILAKLMVAISGSNSNVERAFSILRLLLSDRRLSTSHTLMEMRLRIAVNDVIWTEKEREDLLKRATELYLMKNRKRKLDEDEDGNKAKKQRRMQEAMIVASEDSDTDEETEDETE